jgi:hypothetical protein
MKYFTTADIMNVQGFTPKKTRDFSSASRLFRPESADSNFLPKLYRLYTKLHGTTFKESVFVVRAKSFTS